MLLTIPALWLAGCQVEFHSEGGEPDVESTWDFRSGPDVEAMGGWPAQAQESLFRWEPPSRDLEVLLPDSVVLQVDDEVRDVSVHRNPRSDPHLIEQLTFDYPWEEPTRAQRRIRELGEELDLDVERLASWAGRLQGGGAMDHAGSEFSSARQLGDHDAGLQLMGYPLVDGENSKVRVQVSVTWGRPASELAP